MRIEAKFIKLKDERIKSSEFTKLLFAFKTLAKEHGHTLEWSTDEEKRIERLNAATRHNV